MKDLVEKLIRLQAYDNRLSILKLQKGDLPTVIEQLDSDLDKKQTRTEEMKAEIKKLQSDRRIFEKEVEASKQQLKKYEEQLYHVQNNKEYDAITLEIDTKKMEIENLENKILQTIEDEESLKQETTSLGEEVGQLGEQLTENKGELDDINQHTQKEEDRLVVERDELAVKLEKRFLRTYERIRKAKDGIAVAPIKRNSCSGCFSSVPPQRMVEVRKADRLFNCEYCGRILVWVDDEE